MNQEQSNEQKRDYLFEVDFIREAYNKALSMDAQVWENANHDEQHHSVQVNHLDGSKVIVRYCFVRYAKYRSGDLLVLYPEHLQSMVFAIGDLDSVVTFDGEEEHVIIGELKNHDEDEEDGPNENDLTLAPGMPPELAEAAEKENKSRMLKIRTALYGHAGFEPGRQCYAVLEGSFGDLADEIFGIINNKQKAD